MRKGQGVYILESKKNGRFYIGSTVDIGRRFKEHSDGRVYATKNLRPLKLVLFQEYDDIGIARRVEYKLKKLKNRKIIEKIITDQRIKLGH